MALRLNITANPSGSHGKKVSPAQNSRTSSDKSQPGFSFTFTKQAKVKALVARKRPVTKKPIPALNDTGGTGITTQNLNAQNVDAIESTISLNIVSEPPPAPMKSNDAAPVNPFLSKKEKLMNKQKRKFEEYSKRQVQDSVGGVKSEDSKPDQSTSSGKPVVPKPINTNRGKSFAKKTESLFSKNPDEPMVGQRLIKPIPEKVFSGTAMDSMGLHPHCVKNLADILQITQLTTVQLKTIPTALSGKDILVRSQTGSGKTLAYALPIIQKMQDIRPKITRLDGIFAVVVVPTRELAIQSYELFIKLLKPFTWIVPGYLCGGEKRKSEKARLRKGLNILVATPGRLCDHLLHTDALKLNKTQWFVLDEADRLFEFGYEKDVETILKELRKQRSNESLGVQTMLLSATMSSAVRTLAGLALNEPVYIDTANEQTFTEAEDAVESVVIPETVEQSYVLVPPKLRLVTLSGMLTEETSKGPVKILVFMATTELVNFYHDVMIETLTANILDEEDETNEGNDDEEDKPFLRNVRFFKLHGSMTQHERSAVFKAFKETKSGILLTTDVAARGIDVPKVSLVIQFTAPQRIADYVHRVGRTARAGLSGRTILFLSPNELEFISSLEDKRLRISQVASKKFLSGLMVDGRTGQLEEIVSGLQRKIEAALDDDEELNDKACKAFVSWIRFYSTFPKEFKKIFNVRNAHMGHYAKSFGLRDPPNSFVKEHSAPKPVRPTNRLTYINREERDAQRLANRQQNNKLKRPANEGLNKFAKRSISLTTSEFDSGLMPSKKKKRNA